MMNAIPDNWPGPTANPLLIVNTGHDGNTNPFITPTLVTNCQNRLGNGITIAFENNIPEADKQINARLAEIANLGPLLETMATSHLDCHIPDRHQFTSHGEHQYQSTVVRTAWKIQMPMTAVLCPSQDQSHLPLKNDLNLLLQKTW